MNRRNFIKAATQASVVAAVSRTIRAQSAPKIRIQRLSWAGIKIQSPTSTVFIDPWVTASIWGEVWKSPIVPLEVETKQRFAAVTHLHNDHFDRTALRQILPENRGAVLSSGDMASAIAAIGVSVRAVDLYQPKLLGDWIFTPVPAEDGFGDPQVSWIVSADGFRAIHCGDTMWHGAFHAIGRQYGPFDLAFLPINGPRVWTIKVPSGLPAVMTPEQAAAAGQVVRAKMVIPIHYGVNEDNVYEEFPDAEATFARNCEQRKVPFKIMRPGEWMDMA